MSVYSAPSMVPKELTAADTTIKLRSAKKALTFAQPNQSTTFSPAQPQINIFFPPGINTFENSYLEFFAATNGFVGPATYNRFSQFASCVIQNVIVLLGSQQIANIQNAGQLMAIQLLQNSQDWGSSNGWMWGQGSSALRDTWASGRFYQVDLSKIIGFLGASLMPLNTTAQLQLQIFLAPAASCLESDNAGASYTISNVFYRYYSYINLDTDIIKGIESKMSAGRGYEMTYETYQNINAPLNTGSTNVSLLFNSAYRCVSGLLSIMQPLNTLGSLAVNDKFTGNLLYNGLQQYAYRINSVYYPGPSQVTDYVQAFVELNKYNGKGGCTRCDLYPMQLSPNFSTIQFMMAADLSNGNRSIMHMNNSIINGQDLSTVGSQAYLLLQTTAIPTDNQVNIYLRTSVTTCINMKGDIVYEQ